MYRWLLYGHLLGVGLLVLGAGAYWLTTEALARAAGRPLEPMPIHVIERSLQVLVVGGVVLVGFGVALAAHLEVLAEPWVLAAFFLVGCQGVSGRVLGEGPLRHAKRAAIEPSARCGRKGEAAVLKMSAGARASLPVLAELEFLMAVKPDPLLLTWSVAISLGLSVVLGWTSLRRLGRRAHRRSWT